MEKPDPVPQPAAQHEQPQPPPQFQPQPPPQFQPQPPPQFQPQAYPQSSGAPYPPVGPLPPLPTGPPPPYSGSPPSYDPPPPYTGALPNYGGPFKTQPQPQRHLINTRVPQVRVAVLSPEGWGPDPVHATCPHCRTHMVTEIRPTPGLLTYLLSGALILMGCECCCIIPCCIPECQDTKHHCGECKRYLGTYNRCERTFERAS